MGVRFKTFFRYNGLHQYHLACARQHRCPLPGPSRASTNYRKCVSNFLTCVAGAWKWWAQEKTRSREGDTRRERERVSLARARSLFGPLLPSACYACYEFPFILIGKLTMDFFSKPIMGPTQVGAPEQGFRRCFAEGLNQSLVSSVQQAKITLSHCI